MAQKNRRSISITKAVYDQLREHCHTHGKSMSGVVQKLIVTHLEQQKQSEDTRNTEENKKTSPIFGGGLHNF